MAVDPSESDVVGAGRTLASDGSWRGRVMSRALERAALRSVERGQAFIDAALKLVDREGNTSFTVQEVADLTGQSSRTFYQHFASKDDLILALFEEMLGVHVGMINDAIVDVQDPGERLRTIVIAAIGSTSSQPANRLRGLTHHRLILAETQPEAVAVAEAPFVELVRSTLSDCIDEGVLPDRGLDQMTFLVGTLRTSYIHSLVLGDDLGLTMPDPDLVADFCMRGLGAEDV